MRARWSQFRSDHTVLMPLRTCLSLLVLAALLPASSAGAAVKVRHGVVYGHAQVAAGSAPLVLDLYRPARRATTPRPVVVVIHGGGFARQGRSDPAIVRIARALAARGIVAASIDYRLLGADPRPSRRVAPLLGGLPQAPLGRAIAAAVDDTLTSIGYLRRHAGRLGIDVRRLGLVGSSAGAMTAGHVAYVLDDYGIKGPKVRFVGDLWGGIVVAGGAGRLDRGEAPLFAVHGDADSTVPVRLDDQLVARARSQHVRTEYHRIAGGAHGYAGARFFTEPVHGQKTSFERLLRFARSALR